MSRTLRALAMLAASMALSGCLSIFNAPDRRRLDAGIDAHLQEDGGSDATVDARIDASEDAGPDAHIDGGCRGPRFETTCSDMRDDDCDGPVDCADFDCARDLGCCGSGTALLRENFELAGFSDRWRSLPSSAPPISPSSSRLSNFGISGPRAVHHVSCVPIDLGVRIYVEMQVTGGACGDPADCNYAGIVLTPARDMAPGVSLPEELAVRAYADGRYEVRRAGASLGSMNLGAVPVAVSLELTPGLDEAGNAWVFGRLSVGTWIPYPNPVPLIPRSDLLGTGLGCDAARGLYLAIEGKGPDVSFDRLDIHGFECSNPSHFEHPRGGVIEIAASDLNLLSRWSSGGIGSPAIASQITSPGPPPTVRWDLYVDGSNIERSSELFAPVKFAIGHATTSTADGTGPWTASSSGAPLLGGNPPDCAGCLSHRDPSILVWVNPMTGERARENGLIAFARERDTSPRTFEIAGRLVAVAGGVIVPPGDETVVLTPETAGCRSLRDPVLLPARPDPELDGDNSGVFLLFTCELPAAPPEIRAAWIERTSTFPVKATPIGTVLRPSDVGAIASLGLRAADGEAWFRYASADGGMAPRDVTYRLWMVARDGRGDTSLVFAEGTGMVGEGLPRFQPYAANPVLTERDPLLGSCGTGDCSIESVAVDRSAHDPTRVRVLISRMIVTESDIRHVLVPLDQVWPR